MSLRPLAVLPSSMLVAALLLSSACTIGNGKIPNPKWKPKVEKTVLEARPPTFHVNGLRIHVDRMVAVDYTKYGLVREVQGRWLYYDLQLRVEYTDSSPPGILKNEFEEVEYGVLDGDGEDMLSARGATVTVDLAKSNPSELRAYVRLKFDERLPPREPKVLTVGDQRLPLAR